MNKTLITTIAVFALSTFAAEQKTAPAPKADQKAPAATEAKKTPVLEIIGSIQLQAQKAFWDNKNTDNLDDFFGRANLGASFKTDNFQTLVNIRAFPEGFGYEPLTSAVLDTAADKIQVNKTSIAKFQIEQAWFKFIHPVISLQMGHYDRNIGKTPQFGNYVDQDYSGGYFSRGYYHNATEVTLTTKVLSSAIMLGAGDNKLNTGYLRIYECFTPISSFTLGAAYRANVFDVVYNEKAIVQNRFSFTADYQIIKDLVPYIETGILQKKSKDKYEFPIVLGLKIPTGGFLNMAALEMELLNNRKVNKEDKPVMVDLYLDKKAGTHTRFQFSLASDPAGTKTFDMRLGLRMTVSLK